MFSGKPWVAWEISEVAIQNAKIHIRDEERISSTTTYHPNPTSVGSMDLLNSMLVQ